MGLVDYASDSESEGEQPRASTSASPRPQDLPKKETSRPTIQKVVDRSNPGKIKVTLPGISAVVSSTNDLENEGPDRKRVKLGASGGRQGINAFLPAPKRSTPASAGGNFFTGSSGVRMRGLGPGVSLKTGAEPAFSRERTGSMIAEANADTNLMDDELTATQTPANAAGNSATSYNSQVEEFKPKGKATRFMPLSVSRKPKSRVHSKAEAAGTASAAKATPSSSSIVDQQRSESSVSTPTAKPKISLFSADPSEDSFADAAAEGEKQPTGTYEPLLYDAAAVPGPSPGVPRNEEYQSLARGSAAGGSSSNAQSLDSIAADLNLSASERRQLFGRGPRNAVGQRQQQQHQQPPLAVNLVNFSADAEYAANEELRAASDGTQPELAARQAVRTVNASGKNSLRSLVNVVSGQGDALEEHFAKGRRNKAEAGNRYGF